MAQTSDEEEARIELLEEDDTLSLEATSEEDQDRSRGDVSTELGRTVVVAVILKLLFDILSAGISLRSMLSRETDTTHSIRQLDVSSKFENVP